MKEIGTIGLDLAKSLSKYMASEVRERSLFVGSCGAASYCASCQAFSLAWWAWRRVAEPHYWARETATYGYEVQPPAHVVGWRYFVLVNASQSPPPMRKPPLTRDINLARRADSACPARPATMAYVESDTAAKTIAVTPMITIWCVSRCCDR